MLIVQWTKYVNGKSDYKIEFQTSLHANGDILFTYRNISEKTKLELIKNGSPILISLQSTVKAKNSSKGMF